MFGQWSRFVGSAWKEAQFRWMALRWISRTKPGPTATIENGLPVVAVVGRPNVGKSALFNRLIMQKDAMVKNTPESHVTRDYRCGIAKLGELLFTVVDTSGLEPAIETGTIQARATKITQQLMKRVQLVLFMIDARERLSLADEDVAAWMRRWMKDTSKLLLVANKCESLATDSGKSLEEIRENLHDAYRLGMGEPVSISAETGDGMIDLCEALIPFVDNVKEKSENDTVIPSIGARSSQLLQDLSVDVDIHEEQSSQPDIPIKVAIMGLPNVVRRPNYLLNALGTMVQQGKSSLMNHLVQYERSLCGPEIGLTRDPVADLLTFNDRTIQLIDTAGWMKFFSYEKFSDVGSKLAKEAYYASRKVLNFAHVVIVMLDVGHVPQADLLRQELQLASAVLNEKRILILAINKMDILNASQRQIVQRDVVKRIRARFHEIDHLVCLPISAKTGYGMDRLIPEIIRNFDKWSSKIKTSTLNDWFSEMMGLQRLAQFTDSAMKRIKFISQTKTRPPTFCLRVSGRTPFTNVQKRTFLNALRQGFDFRGIPLRVTMKYKTTWNESKQLIIAKQQRKRLAA